MSDSSSVYSDSEDEKSGGCVRVTVELEPTTGVPPEMCEFLSVEEFGSALPWLLSHKGFEWCRANCSNMVAQFPELGEDGEEEALTARMAEMGLGGGQQGVGTSGAAGAGGGESKSGLTATQIRKKGEKSKEVVIERNARNKRKCTTIVRGLELFGVALGDAAKQFKKKFACGCAVVTNAEQKEEVVIQGDVVDDVADYVVSKLGVSGKAVYTMEGKQKTRYG